MGALGGRESVRRVDADGGRDRPPGQSQRGLSLPAAVTVCRVRGDGGIVVKPSLTVSATKDSASSGGGRAIRRACELTPLSSESATDSATSDPREKGAKPIALRATLLVVRSERQDITSPPLSASR